MFPLRDDNPTEITPILTMGLILGCVATWVLVQGAGFDQGTLQGSVCRWGFIPGALTGASPSVSLPPGTACGEGGGAVTVLTSMFLHGSWPHLIGNLWFLWIFGNNVEDSMGHLRYLLFYLLTGAAAVGAQAWADPGSPLPMVGASGAISGIMGAYLVLYPRARISTLFIILILVQVVWVPAWVMLGYWFLIQFMAGASQPAGQGGVAFWAHIGGFVAGVLLVKPFENRTLSNAKRARVHLSRGEIPRGGWW